MEVDVGDEIFCWFPLSEYEVENEYNELYYETDNVLFGSYRRGIVIKKEGHYDILVDFPELKEINLNSEIWFHNGISNIYNSYGSKVNTLVLSVSPPKEIIKKHTSLKNIIIEELDYVDVDVLSTNKKIKKKFEAFKKWAKNEIESI